MTRPAKFNAPRTRPYKLAGVGLLIVGALLLFLVFGQFRGDFTAKTKLTMVAPRAGLVMDPGAKVTYNGVEIGRVGNIAEALGPDGKPAARFTLDVYPRYLALIPENVNAQIKATTVFGGKYVSFTTPRDANGNSIARGHLRPSTVIDATAVTTEINTLFQTITSIAEKVDPVKLNLTLSAAAQSLTGLGDKFGQSIVNANAILDDVNPQMPQARHDIQQLAGLGDTYANAAPDLFDFLNNAVITSRTINQQQKDLDQALLSAAGFGNAGADIFEKGGPYLARGAADLVPSAQLLNTYSPELFCTVRNYHDEEPRAAAFLGGNGYSLNDRAELLSGLGLFLNPVAAVAALGSLFGGLGGLVGGAPNPYMWPENLPRVNARGGPGGAPGCWQHITHDLWPAPNLVMDAGVSIAPYNHVSVGSPYAIEYVWGRQVGDNSINP
jgi:phospholipid/cholesterol/gamma-HCH transport system substrate-binding protein